MAVEKDKLVECIMEMNSNPDMMARYHNNPVEAAQAFGLAEADVALIANDDQAAIQARFRASGETLMQSKMVATHTP